MFKRHRAKAAHAAKALLAQKATGKGAEGKGPTVVPPATGTYIHHARDVFLKAEVDLKPGPGVAPPKVPGIAPPKGGFGQGAPPDQSGKGPPGPPAAPTKAGKGPGGYWHPPPPVSGFSASEGINSTQDLQAWLEYAEVPLAAVEIDGSEDYMTPTGAWWHGINLHNLHNVIAQLPSWRFYNPLEESSHMQSFVQCGLPCPYCA